ncbi:unnamed protein product [Boreogadus saida]
MDPSSLASVLGHLAQRAERQTQLQQAQNEVLVELAGSLATDREAMRELLGSGERGGETRPWRHIYVPKMGEADDPEAFLETFRGVAEADASDRGLGAVLTQQVEGTDRPVLCLSRKLSDREATFYCLYALILRVICFRGIRVARAAVQFPGHSFIRSRGTAGDEGVVTVPGPRGVVAGVRRETWRPGVAGVPAPRSR